MNAIFNATNAAATLSTASGEIGVFVLATFAMLVGLHLAIVWFKRGVSLTSTGGWYTDGETTSRNRHGNPTRRRKVKHFNG